MADSLGRAFRAAARLLRLAKKMMPSGGEPCGLSRWPENALHQSQPCIRCLPR